MFLLAQYHKKSHYLKAVHICAQKGKQFDFSNQKIIRQCSMKLTNVSFKKSSQVGCPPTVLTDSSNSTNIPCCVQLCPGAEQFSNKKINPINARKPSTDFLSPHKYEELNESRYTNTLYGNDVSQLSYGSNMSQASSQPTRLMGQQQPQPPQSPTPSAQTIDMVRYSRINTAPAPQASLDSPSFQSSPHMKASIDHRIQKDSQKQNQQPSNPNYSYNVAAPTNPPTPNQSLQRCLSSHAPTVRNATSPNSHVLISQSTVSAYEQSVKPQSTQYRSPMKDAVKSIEELNTQLRMMKGQSSANEEARRSMLRQLSAEHKIMQQQLNDQKGVIASREKQLLDIKAKADRVELQNTQMKQEKVLWEMEKTRHMIKEAQQSSNYSEVNRLIQDNNRLLGQLSTFKAIEERQRQQIKNLELQLKREAELKQTYCTTLQKIKRDVSDCSGIEITPDKNVADFVAEQIESHIIENRTSKMMATNQIKLVSAEFQEKLEQSNSKYLVDQKKFAQSLSEMQMKCDRRDSKIALLQHQIELLNEQNRGLKTIQTSLEDRLYGDNGLQPYSKRIQSQNQLIKQLVLGQRCNCCKTAQLLIQLDKDPSEFLASMNLSEVSRMQTKKINSTPQSLLSDPQSSDPIREAEAIIS